MCDEHTNLITHQGASAPFLFSGFAMRLKYKIGLTFAFIICSYSSYASDLYKITQFPLNGYTLPNSSLSVGYVGTREAIKSALMGQAVYKGTSQKGSVYNVNAFSSYYVSINFCSGNYCSIGSN